jgi:hypothetical protein
MFSPLRLAIALLLPALLIGGWLGAEQLPVWTQIRYEAIRTPDGGSAPAACEAAALLRQWDARHIDPGGITPQQAIARARAGLAVQGLDAPQDTVHSLPIGAEIALNGQRRAIWLITFALDAPRRDAYGIALPGPAALVVVDAADGGVIYPGLIAAAPPDPASACPFDVRGALVDLVRSPAFLLFAGYIGLTAILLSGAGLFWWMRRRKGAR